MQELPADRAAGVPASRPRAAPLGPTGASADPIPPHPPSAWPAACGNTVPSHGAAWPVGSGASAAAADAPAAGARRPPHRVGAGVRAASSDAGCAQQRPRNVLLQYAVSTVWEQQQCVKLRGLHSVPGARHHAAHTSALSELASDARHRHAPLLVSERPAVSITLPIVQCTYVAISLCLLPHVRVELDRRTHGQ